MKKFLLGAAALVVALTTFSCQQVDYSTDIDQLKADVSTLSTSVAGLQQAVNGLTYIKSITLGSDGKLTITPSSGSAIVYDCNDYVAFEVELKNNALFVNGKESGKVDFPDPEKFVVGLKDGVVTINGESTDCDIASWLAVWLKANGFNAFDPATLDYSKVTVKDGKLYIDGTEVAAFTDIEVKDGKLYINKVEVGNFNPTITLGTDGFLYVNGVKTDVEIPGAVTVPTIVYIKNAAGDITGVTISNNGETCTISQSPAHESLSGLIFIPKLVDDGYNAITVGYLYNAYTTKTVGTILAGTYYNNTNIGTPVWPSVPYGIFECLYNTNHVQYRVNPKDADLTDVEWKFINFQAEVRATGDADDLFLADNAPKDFNTDIADARALDFKLKLNKWYDPEAGLTHLFALMGTYKDAYSGETTTIVSDYTKVFDQVYTAFISDKVNSKFTNPLDVVDFNADKTSITTWGATGTPKAAPYVKANFNLVAGTFDATGKAVALYNGKPANLNDFVLATAIEAAPGVALPSPIETSMYDALGAASATDHPFYHNGVNRGKLIDDFYFDAEDLKWSFKEIDYNGPDGVTNQAAFIEADAEGNLYIVGGTSAYDREPVFEIDLRTNDANKLQVASNAFVKFCIARAEVLPQTFTVVGPTIAYPKLYRGAPTSGTATPYDDNLYPLYETVSGVTTYNCAIDWVTMNSYYAAMGLSHDDFRAQYDPTIPGTVVKAEYYDTWSAATPAWVDVAWTPAGQTITEFGKFNIKINDPSVDTYQFGFQPTPYWKYSIAADGTRILPKPHQARITIQPAGKPAMAFVFTFDVQEVAPTKKILTNYHYDGSNAKVMTKGINIDLGTPLPTAPAAEQYEMILDLGEIFNYGNDYADGTSGYRSFFLQNAAGITLPFGTSLPAQVGKITGATHRFYLAEDLTDDKYFATFDYGYLPVPTSATAGVYNRTAFDGERSPSTPANWGIAATDQIENFIGNTNIVTPGQIQNRGILMGLKWHDLSTTAPVDDYILRDPIWDFDVVFNTTFINGEEDEFKFKVYFVNPFTIESLAPITLNDNVAWEDVNVEPLFNVKMNGKYIWKGAAKNDATTGAKWRNGAAGEVDAPLYVNIAADYTGLANKNGTSPDGMWYDIKLPAVQEYFTIIKAGAVANINTTTEAVATPGNLTKDLRTGWFEWKNTGSKLMVDTVVADAEVTFKSRFAWATTTQPIKVLKTL